MHLNRYFIRIKISTTCLGERGVRNLGLAECVCGRVGWQCVVVRYIWGLADKGFHYIFHICLWMPGRDIEFMPIFDVLYRSKYSSK